MVCAVSIALLGSVAFPSRERGCAVTTFDVAVLSTHVGVDIDEATVWHGTAAGAIRAKTPAPAFHVMVATSRGHSCPTWTSSCRTPPATSRSDHVPLYELHRVYRV